MALAQDVLNNIIKVVWGGMADLLVIRTAHRVDAPYITGRLSPFVLSCTTPGISLTQVLFPEGAGWYIMAPNVTAPIPPLVDPVSGEMAGRLIGWGMPAIYTQEVEEQAPSIQTVCASGDYGLIYDGVLAGGCGSTADDADSWCGISQATAFEKLAEFLEQVQGDTPYYWLPTFVQLSCSAYETIETPVQPVYQNEAREFSFVNLTKIKNIIRANQPPPDDPEAVPDPITLTFRVTVPSLPADMGFAFWSVRVGAYKKRSLFKIDNEGNLENEFSVKHTNPTTDEQIEENKRLGELEIIGEAASFSENETGAGLVANGVTITLTMKFGKDPLNPDEDEPWEMTVEQDVPAP